MSFAPTAPWRPAWRPPAASTPAGGRRGSLSLASLPTRGDSGRALFSIAGGRTHEPRAFQETVLVHLDAAYNLARYLTRDPLAAEDVAQEAVLKAFRHFDGYRGGDAKAWLMTIVRRQFADWCAERRTDRGVFMDPEPGQLEAVPDPSEDDPELGLLRAGDVEAVRRAVEALPEPFREAVVLRELEEMSYRQIADITGAPIGTVMSRLARGRVLLAVRLRPPAGGVE